MVRRFTSLSDKSSRPSASRIPEVGGELNLKEVSQHAD